jgi:hypothetical protein
VAEGRPPLYRQQNGKLEGWAIYRGLPGGDGVMF